MAKAWAEDEFVLDPSRLTLFVGATGIDGDTFKQEHLMARRVSISGNEPNTTIAEDVVIPLQDLHLIVAKPHIQIRLEQRIFRIEESGFVFRPLDQQC